MRKIFLLAFRNKHGKMGEDPLWSEKYRPERLSEILGQESVTEDLRGFVKSGSLPHMIFAGPPGSGKTVVALAVARELYGEEYSQYFRKVDCSDGGVMARRKPLPGEGGGEIQKAKRRSSGSSADKRLRIRKEILNHLESPPMGDVPHKILYLLDFDLEDRKTQNALRRPMETYSDNCRFILAVRNSSNIIPAIQSRCAVFRLGRLSEEGVKNMLSRIEEGEGVELEESGLEAIVRIAEGDIRLAANLFHAASTLEEKVSEDAVYEVSEAAKPRNVRKMVKSAFNGDFEGARKTLRNLLIKRGIDPEVVLYQIQSEIGSLDIPEPMRVKLIGKMGEFDFKLIESSSERIQLENVLMHLARLGNRLKS